MWLVTLSIVMIGSTKWLDPNRCREFFDGIAKELGKDPLDPQTWESIHLATVCLAKKVRDYFTTTFPSAFLIMYVFNNNLKGGRHIQRCHGGLRKALMVAYPQVQFFRR